MSENNVVSLATKLTQAPPLSVRRKGWDECGHKAVDLVMASRKVICRDCGEEGIDPFEALVHLADQWSRWAYEAKELTRLRTEQNSHERAVWERARDRHLNAHPDHVLDMTRRGWTFGEGCRICQRLEQNGSRWAVPEVSA